MLHNKLFVPEFTYSLLSVSYLLANLPLSVTFTNKLCLNQDHTLRNLIGAGEQRDGVYLFQPWRQVKAYAATIKEKQELWD